MSDKCTHLETGVGILKIPTGIPGLDSILRGGLADGRPTLVTGSSGTGKTLFGIQFLVAGAHQFEEPGVFFSFEERVKDLASNTTSLNFNLNALCRENKLLIEDVRIPPAKETGQFSLDALMIRMEQALSKVHAKRLVLDTIESLMVGFENTSILRAEIGRVFDWLRSKSITTIVTGEKGNGDLSRYGIEEYISDCVIQLNQHLTNSVSTRTLRVIKYRGSSHGSNDYPFLIDRHGISVHPITEIELDYPVSTERISTGISGLDEMIQGGGYFRGSSVLVSGTAGTGKSSIAAQFIDSSAKKNIKALYFSYEEPPAQIIRNMQSIGINLQKWIDIKQLQIYSARPSQCGLEVHLVSMQNEVIKFNPGVVALDPISGFYTIGTWSEIHSMLNRFIDFLKKRRITCIFTQLITSQVLQNEAEMAIPSTIDTWITLRGVEVNGEFDRVLHIVKSRGMQHSNQVREFVFTPQGVDLINAYLGPAGMLTGSARSTQEAQERSELVRIHKEIESQKTSLKRRREALNAKLKAQRTEFEAYEIEVQSSVQDRIKLLERMKRNQDAMAKIRKTGQLEGKENGKKIVAHGNTRKTA